MDTPTKIAVITGAGSGIGRATAHALLEDGWTVVLAGRRRDMLEETAALAETPPPRTLVVPTDVRDPAADRGAVRRGQDRPTAASICLFNNAGISTRGIPFEDLTYEQWIGCRRGQSDRLVPLRPARLPHDEGAGPAGRAHHQQRLGLGACAAAQLDALRLDQARADRADPVAVARRAPIQHRLRPDRHRQRRDRRATRTPRAVDCRPPAGSRPRRASMSATSPRASSTWPSLPLDANVQFMTVMATKMPISAAAELLTSSNFGISL